MKSNNNNLFISIAITAVIAGGVGYYIGQKSGATVNTSGRGQMMTGGQGMGRGGFARGGSNGNVVAGEVVNMSDASLTVKTRDGSSRVVLLTGGTKVAKQVEGIKTDVKQGLNVMVIGTQNGDGSVTAETVQIRPAGFGTSTGMMR
jgi:hypothetical protein